MTTESTTERVRVATVNAEWSVDGRYGRYVRIGADSVAERTRSADCGGGGIDDLSGGGGAEC